MPISRQWVLNRLSERVVVENGQELLVLEDWDTPPADTALAEDKRNWGGRRTVISVDDFVAKFSVVPIPPTTPRLPNAEFDALLAHDDQQKDGAGNVTRGAMGFGKYLQQWREEGLI